MRRSSSVYAGIPSPLTTTGSARQAHAGLDLEVVVLDFRSERQSQRIAKGDLVLHEAAEQIVAHIERIGTEFEIGLIIDGVARLWRSAM